MFMLVRLGIGLLGFVLFFAVVNLMHIKLSRKTQALSMVVWCLIISLSYFVPIENTFMQFDSAEDVYRYVNFDEAKFTIPGIECDFVVGGDENNDNIVIVPKNSDSWYIGLGMRTKRIAQIFENSMLINIYNYEGTRDYFVHVISTTAGDFTISDAMGSNFLSRTKKICENIYVDYFTSITESDESYWICVNDDKILVEYQTDK